jgi:D-threo-aldose 1-dehydrogenase
VNSPSGNGRQGDRVTLRTGLEISKFGLGTAAFGGLYQSVPFHECWQSTVTALENGVTFFDTAPHYGKGVSEKRLGSILKSKNRDSFQVSTKVGRILVDTTNEVDDFFLDADVTKRRVYDYSAAGVERSIKESLERLQMDRLDLVFIHDPEGNEESAISEAAPMLSKLRDQGYITAYGIGMNICETPIRFIKETDIDVVLIAGRYSLLDQSAAVELLPLAMKRNVDVIVAGVFNSGLLANPQLGATYDYIPASPELISKASILKESAKAFGVSIQAAATQFPLKNPAVKSILVGCRSESEVISNLEAFNEEIPAEFWQELGFADQ